MIDNTDKYKTVLATLDGFINWQGVSDTIGISYQTVIKYKNGDGSKEYTYKLICDSISEKVNNATKNV